MTDACCFQCGKSLGISKSMEELLEARFPVFCGINCSSLFPDNGTIEFDNRLKELGERLSRD